MNDNVINIIKYFGADISSFIKLRNSLERLLKFSQKTKYENGRVTPINSYYIVKLFHQCLSIFKRINPKLEVKVKFKNLSI